MTLRRCCVAVAVLSLACGSSEPPTIEVGPAVDAAKGPPDGPKLGSPLGALGGESLGTSNSYGDSYTLPDASLFGVTMGVRADVKDDVLVHLEYKAVLPDPDGVDRCEVIRDGLTALYGEPRKAGVPLFIPMDIWSGEQHGVSWTRRARIENGGVVCTVSWGPPIEDEAE